MELVLGDKGPAIRRAPRGWILALGLAALLYADARAQARQPPRARRPDWSKTDTKDVFFDDAVEEALQGERPSAPKADDGTDGTVQPGPGSATQNSKKTSVWERLVTAEALEGEIKAQSIVFRSAVMNQAHFAREGATAAEESLMIVAIGFSVVADFQEDVRWKDNAAAMRNELGRAVIALSATDVEANIRFDAAVAARAIIQETLNGSRITSASPPLARSDFADRHAIMTRLEIALEQRLAPALANARSFAADAEMVNHESQWIALLATVLGEADMPDAEADDYQGWLADLTRTAGRLRQAVSTKDLPIAREAFAAAQRACAACHDNYR